jgi:hypothetical protein
MLEYFVFDVWNCWVAGVLGLMLQVELLSIPPWAPRHAASLQHLGGRVHRFLGYNCEINII